MSTLIGGINMARKIPLSRAVCAGDEGVVGMLLERENFNPNTTDNSNHRPLFGADTPRATREL